MGTLYRVGCHDCGAYRDLDKITGNPEVTPDTRAEAFQYMERLEKDPFRWSLLLAFMIDHASHKCVFFSEHIDDAPSLQRLEPELSKFW